MKQQSFSKLVGVEKHRKVTWHAQFLDETNSVIPWVRLLALIDRYHRNAGNGHPPNRPEVMLRMNCLQLRFNIFSLAVSETLYDSLAMRAFVCVNSKTGQIHSAAVTPAHTDDSVVFYLLRHGNETKV